MLEHNERKVSKPKITQFQTHNKIKYEARGMFMSRETAQ
jgi:hypothetical protein